AEAPPIGPQPEAPASALPTPPGAHPAMPADNYDPDPRAGEVWETGIASFYGPREQGRETASGAIFDYHQMTAAHRLLPLGTVVRVTDLKTGKSVRVTINDRGPFWPNRLLDLSWGAAQKIGDQGLDPVRIQIVSLPSPVPAGVFTVMVGWFTDDGALEQCRRAMLAQLNQPVLTLHSDEGRWLRFAKSVRLDRPTATTVVQALRAQNFQAYLVRLN
ncbi:MAG: septal ring lytic transglycosylase RlpA family protein, partial [Terriglobales bacterium]